ncbi:MAG: hypothetical protein KA954_15070 [Chitinophagales bacterium]|nr:hypothetical protein [Chitinophagales bacterium]MBP9190383.1 hypothetical protein [Chitinophagales bacterium]MBP9705945.1 hypothetical protein [Chitinophagales bacterium]
MKKLIMIAVVLMIGTISMAQSAPEQKADSDKKEAMGKPQIKSLKKVDVTVIEKTESDSVKETPAETPTETPATNQVTNKKQVEKSKTVKNTGVETKPTKKAESSKSQARSKE